MTVAEAARVSGRSTTWVRNRIEAGQLPLATTARPATVMSDDVFAMIGSRRKRDAANKPPRLRLVINNR